MLVSKYEKEYDHCKGDLMVKDIVIIGGLTLAVICGAITGIVGGALGISMTAAVIHAIVGG